MIVYKFGGIALATVENIGRVVDIIRCTHDASLDDQALVIVVSAMGKNTNHLEALLGAARRGDTREQERLLNEFVEFHRQLCTALFNDPSETLIRIEALAADLAHDLNAEEHPDPDYHYDRVVAYGELLSSLIVSDYLAECGFSVSRIDARRVLRSNAHHQNATLDWELSAPLVRTAFTDIPGHLYVTQGFIASDPLGATTTLGREGSDYTATLVASFRCASQLTIWKDVPGLFTTDPKLFPGARPLPELTYQDAIRMAYHGAKIIHPRALQPLQQAKIPLHVRSFLDPEAQGSRVQESLPDQPLNIPRVCFIAPIDYLRITPRNLAFVMEEVLHELVNLLMGANLTIHEMHTEGVSVGIMLRADRRRIESLRGVLEAKYHLTLLNNLTLLTVLEPSTADRDTLLGLTAGLYARYDARSLQILAERNEWNEKLVPALQQMIERYGSNPNAGQ